MMPGKARPRETIILFRDLIRLKRRKTRNARSMRSWLSGPGRSTAASEGSETPTTRTSKRFQLEQRKWPFRVEMYQVPYMFHANSKMKIIFQKASMTFQSAL
jgi:hypothetical protein